MKKYFKILPLAAIFFAFSVNAEVELKESSEILGKWKLHDESIRLNGDKKHVDVEWDVRADGTIHTTTSDVAGRISEMKIMLKYSIENGGIKKQSAPGREKYELCKVIEKTDTDMVLHCTYFFYLTKIK